MYYKISYQMEHIAKQITSYLGHTRYIVSLSLFISDDDYSTDLKLTSFERYDDALEYMIRVMSEKFNKRLEYCEIPERDAHIKHRDVIMRALKTASHSRDRVIMRADSNVNAVVLDDLNNQETFHYRVVVQKNQIELIYYNIDMYIDSLRYEKISLKLHAYENYQLVEAHQASTIVPEKPYVNVTQLEKDRFIAELERIPYYTAEIPYMKCYNLFEELKASMPADKYKEDVEKNTPFYAMSIDYDALNKFRDLKKSKEPYSADDWKQFTREVGAFIINIQTIIKEQTKTLTWLKEFRDKMIEEQSKKEIDPALIKQIEELVHKSHDVKHTEEAHAHIIYNDGEITSQKGGELFGRRSEFVMKPALVLPVKIKFPLEGRNGYSYAYVTEEAATEIRKLLGQLIV